ncbi:GNAT family N-acetyltransferase [Abyssisolibacter fermentans]|uniref:GNAT family N-acetyltransferase n=1 Tax=Abyssisolibacter fermentans TaxID=1766203 RepID=UPI00082AD087|nr:GNAT family N-acetyltransferase [Abyssisolibacter fermentans]
MNIKLEPVNESNYWACIEMPELDYVASNVVSLAQAYVYEDWYPFCIYNDDTLVGFTLYAIDHEDKDEYWMVRLYIAKEHQNKGYGKEAVKKLIKLVKDKYNCKKFHTSTEPENKRGLHVYESIGFKRTGRIEDEEEILVYEFND